MMGMKRQLSALIFAALVASCAAPPEAPAQPLPGTAGSAMPFAAPQPGDVPPDLRVPPYLPAPPPLPPPENLPVEAAPAPNFAPGLPAGPVTGYGTGGMEAPPGAPPNPPYPPGGLMH
jgi:hypothetical protein